MNVRSGGAIDYYHHHQYDHRSHRDSHEDDLKDLKHQEEEEECVGQSSKHIKVTIFLYAIS